jgi:NADP-dependent 3-hydroxy acid dehydrogenase YdfG
MNKKELRLKDKVVVITGAAGGIGTAVAHLFAEEGAVLVLTDIRREKLEEVGRTLKESGKRVLVQAHDVTDPESWTMLMEKIQDELGRIDILINNAGVVQPGAAEKIAINHIQNQVEVNFLGTVYGCRAALRLMKAQKSGKIINVASLGGIVPMPGEAVYSATKHAIRGYSLSLFAELLDAPINITVVCPDSVETPQLDYELLHDEAVMSFIGEPMLPEKVAQAVFSASLKNKSERLVPTSMGVFCRTGMAFPGIFFFLFPLLKKIGLRTMKKRRKERCDDKHLLLNINMSDSKASKADAN